MKQTATVALLIGLAIVPFATPQGPATREGVRPHADFTLTAGDHYFRMPESVTAGWKTIRFHNAGSEFHHAVFLRVQNAAQADSALAALRDWREDVDRAVPHGVSVGGVEGSLEITPGKERPGADTYVTLNLEEGYYLVLCMIPGEDGLHASRGMHARLRVTSARRVRGGAFPPRPDAILRASDYSFQLMPQRLRAGWRLLEVMNLGPADHVADVARLRPGRKLADIVTPTDGAPDPEAAVVGGSTRMSPGRRSFVWLYLTPGTYVVTCPLRNAAHRMHVSMGMIATLQVR